jgi:ribosomal protein S18 acetylase RimI-like enzyme
VSETGRWLASPGELRLLQEFNGRAIAEVGQAGYVHPGDIVHRMFSGCRHYEPSRLFRLWEDRDGIAAWIHLQPRHAAFEVQVRPDRRGGGFELDLLLWGESALLDLLAEVGNPATELAIDVYSDDPARLEAAVAAGWQHKNDPFFLTERSTANVAAVSLPDGYTFRAARREEAEAIGALHAVTFGSTWKPGEYATLMGTFGYSPDREWLVVAPDGSLAGFTVTWHDPISGRGLFEPVGVHPDHRARGVGRALMARGLAQMRQVGLHTATVCFAGGNGASRALYIGSGFEIAHEIACYAKAVPISHAIPVRRDR